MEGNERVISFNEGGKIHKYMLKKVVEDLIKEGYDIYTKYWTTIDGRRLSIDAVAEKENERIAIECYVQPQLKYIMKKIELLKKSFDKILIVVPDYYDKFFVKSNKVDTIHVSLKPMYENNNIQEELEALRKKLLEYEALIKEYEKRIEELEEEKKKYIYELRKVKDIYYLILENYNAIKNGRIAKFQLYSPEDDSIIYAYLFIDNKDNKLKVKYYDKATSKWRDIGEVVKMYVDKKFIGYRIKMCEDAYKKYEQQINAVLEELKYRLEKLERDYNIDIDIVDKKLEFTTAYNLYQSKINSCKKDRG